MNILNFGEALIDGRPTKSVKQIDADRDLARVYVTRMAPDLLEMLGLGDGS